MLGVCTTALPATLSAALLTGLVCALHMQAVLATLDSSASTFLNDYGRKVLKKADADSDDDDGDV